MIKHISIALLSLTVILSFTACKKAPVNETMESLPVLETVDPFAVEVQLESLGSDDNSSGGGSGSTDTNGDTSNSTTETTSDLSIAEQEAVMAAEAHEEAMKQSESAYQSYLESDIETEIELRYLRADGDTLIFTDAIYKDENENFIEDSSAREYKVAKASVSGEVASLSENDLAIIKYNGAVDVDNNLVKVYSIENETAIINAEEAALDAEEEANEHEG